MVRHTIETDEHGMFMNRERVENHFRMMGQVAQIEALIRKEYDRTGEQHKDYATVYCKSIAEILGINLEGEDILDFSTPVERKTVF